MRWRWLASLESCLSLREGYAVFGSRDGACYALDAVTGAVRWRSEIGSAILASPAVAAGCVLFARTGLIPVMMLAAGLDLHLFLNLSESSP
jgi:outer membrane protein assembly factor BamB